MPTRAIKQQYEAHYTRWVIVALVVLGIACMLLRHFLLDDTHLSETSNVWTVNIEVTTQNTRTGDRFILSPPLSSPGLRLISQNLLHADFRHVRGPLKRGIVLQALQSGDLSFAADFHILVDKETQNLPPVKSALLDPKLQASYLASQNKMELADPELTRILEQLETGTVTHTDRVNKLFAFVRDSIKKRKGEHDDSAHQVLTSRKATALGKARLMVALSRAAKIPARVITGFVLDENYDSNTHYWAEIYNGNNWDAYDPYAGFAINLPVNYLAMNRGNGYFITTAADTPVKTSYSIYRNFELTDLYASDKQQFSDLFNLRRFSPEVRSNLSLMLLLPVAVLLTALLRTMAGIRAYGTFTPALLALAAVYADWFAAMVLLVIVIGIALTGRTAMPDKLTRIPRMATIFTLVSIGMVAGVSIMDYYNLDPAGHVILLPVVILSTLVDRFYSAVDDNGIVIGLHRLLWTFIIGLACYPLLQIDELGEWLLGYPEFHLLTLAAILMMSTYKGRRLSDMTTFKWLREPAKPPGKVTNKAS